MDQFREIKNNLTWHNEGKFEVELVNGIIKKLNFCEPGNGPGDTGKSLTSTNFKFLQSVYTCLGDLFAFIEEENKRMGYSYAQPETLVHHKEIPEDSYLEVPGEPKLRPLINYDHQPDLITSSTETEKVDKLLEQASVRLKQDIGLTA